MSQNTSIRIAGIILFLGVSLGAIGAHLFKDILAANDRTGTWETAAFYHLIHGIALFVVALSSYRPVGYYFFLAGIVLFSGSLYTMAITDISKLGAITPFGGVCFLVGWARWIFFRKLTQQD